MIIFNYTKIIYTKTVFILTFLKIMNKNGINKFIFKEINTMIDGYNLFLQNLESKYPEVYFKLCSLPQASIYGIINGFQSSNVNFNDEDKVVTYFKNIPSLREYTEIEFKIK